MPTKGVPFRRRQVLLDAFRIGVAATLAVYISRLWPFAVSADLPEVWGRAADIAVGMIVGGLLFVLFCLLLRVRELYVLLDRLRSRLRR